jgi:hypothetical protein
MLYKLKGYTAEQPLVPAALRYSPVIRVVGQLHVSCARLPPNRLSKLLSLPLSPARWPVLGARQANVPKCPPPHALSSSACVWLHRIPSDYRFQLYSAACGCRELRPSALLVCVPFAERAARL